ncbi:hypothetical protein CYMTET_35447 [Cymbomonas tetramitiformis]|uniref:Uncharacterized protein n=1 Tax=Cymbomonas tetramitiformis TaxID=36881 RepID=A0AAE0F956_9CHLO|nr:hypothetical protein CYMTET_35447 [Cymbomonas tetramitiformis]
MLARQALTGDFILDIRTYNLVRGQAQKRLAGVPHDKRTGLLRCRRQTERTRRREAQGKESEAICQAKAHRQRAWISWWEEAVQHENWDAVVMLAGMPRAIQCQSTMANTLVERCTDKPVVAILLDAGVNPNDLSRNGTRALVQACMKGHTKIVRALLAAGADPNLVDVSGDTPLIKAVWRRENTEIVRQLLEAGADVNMMDGYKRTPLTKAAWWGRSEAIQVLLQAGAQLQPDGGGLTALIEATLKGHVAAASVLVDGGAACDQCDSHGRLPLVVAAAWEDAAVAEKLIRVLVRGGALPNALDGSGLAALHVVRTSGAVRALAEVGAEVGLMDIAGRSPARCAFDQGNREVMQALIEAGADAGDNAAGVLAIMKDYHFRNQ